MGLRAGLDRCEKSRPHRDSIPGPSSPLAVAIPTELPGPPKCKYVVLKHKLSFELCKSEYMIAVKKAD